MKKEIEVNRIFSNYNIDSKKYEIITYLSRKELSMYTNSSRLYMGKNFLLKRALELIKMINNYNSTVNRSIDTTIANNNHRAKINFEKEIEKQIFINNFVFYDNEQFVDLLNSNNIKLDDIENLINKIMEFKKHNKGTGNYDLNISDIFDVDYICNYYNFNNKEIIINKIFELYYLNNDLLKELREKEI